MKRAIIIVLDSVGIGALPDAANFGDAGSNTLVSEINETSTEAKPISSPMSSGVTYLMFVFSIQTTRSS